MSDKEIKPVIKADPLYQMLRQEDVDGFNANRDSRDTSELTGGDYRGRDLRRMNARGLDFSNAYFRNCDLSGIDFQKEAVRIQLSEHIQRLKAEARELSKSARSPRKRAPRVSCTEYDAR